MAHVWETPAWSALSDHVQTISNTHLRDLLKDEDRAAALVAEFDNVVLDLSHQRATKETLDLLLSLGSAAKVEDRIRAMFSGEKINITEGRSVLHTALRNPRDVPFSIDGQDVTKDVHDVLDKIETYSNKIRNGQHLGATGKPLTDVVSIGIGGSYLGVEFVFESLKHDKDGHEAAKGRRLRFLANVDPVDVSRAIEGLNPETTLVIIISKTFTTAETMLNAKTLRDWLVRGIPSAAEAEIVKAHMCAVSSAVPLVTKFGIAEENIFGFWDWVGGRYSVTSAVGIAPLAIHYGFPLMKEFLNGAHVMDRHFSTAPLSKNLPVLMALFGVWNSTFLGHGSRALLPYSQALLRFPAHIQQVSMESNGKGVAIDGTKLPFSAGVVEFGEPGTNGQHSFYQLIHQGRVVPAEFIGFIESQTPIELSNEQVSNHDELMSNFFAQPDALAIGKTEAEVRAEGTPEHIVPHKVFEGNRPSLSLLLPRLNAHYTGLLLSLYEHRTAAEGFLWDVASFDQWGVELGKVLAKGVRTELHSVRQKQKAGGSEIVTVSGSFVPSTQRLLQRYIR